MAQYQAGNQAAFESIYRLTSGAVAGYVSRWARGGPTGDLVQDVFLEVIKARRTYRPEQPFRPWLFAIATHVGMTAARRRRRKFDPETDIETVPQARLAQPQAPDLLWRQLEEALERLPKDQQDVVWLARVEGMTSNEIGAVVGASAGAVKVRLHRAEAKLREWLGAQGMAPLSSQLRVLEHD